MEDYSVDGMAFIDTITIHASAGKGGNGIVRWLRQRSVPRGGPAGGDGGKGGDIVLLGVRDIAALKRYQYEKKFQAENGNNGSGNNCHGSDGESLVLIVPIGTRAKILETGQEVEILKEGETLVLFSGGVGGFGNSHFKSSTNQNPFQMTEGAAGESGTITLELKIIADGGIIGLPNAGKSSLLNALTSSKAKVGSYPFTTLGPNLGAFYGYIIADIPGLIEGAAQGKGLGSRFLKHIERTNILIHMISLEQKDPVNAYHTIRNELESFGEKLIHKKEIIVLSKTDMVSKEVLDKRKKDLSNAINVSDIYDVSSIDDASLKKFSDTITGIFSATSK